MYVGSLDRSRLDRVRNRPSYLNLLRIFNNLFFKVVLTGICYNAVTSGSLNCPGGWRQFDAKCYKIFSSSPSTFSAANTSCYQVGSQLASLPNKRVADFVTTLLKETWSSQLCMSQVEWCQHSRPSNEDTLCRHSPCLSLWVGLVKYVPCTTCSRGDAYNRAGWSWLDGSVYDATQTRWADNKPTGHQSFARFGVFNRSVLPCLGDRDQSNVYRFICSKDATVSPTVRPAPTSPTRPVHIPRTSTTTPISGTTPSSGGFPGTTTTQDSNIGSENKFITGVTVGFPVGFVVLVVAIIAIICLVKKTRPRLSEVKSPQEVVTRTDVDGYEEVDNTSRPRHQKNNIIGSADKQSSPRARPFDHVNTSHDANGNGFSNRNQYEHLELSDFQNWPVNSYQNSPNAVEYQRLSPRSGGVQLKR